MSMTNSTTFSMTPTTPKAKTKNPFPTTPNRIPMPRMSQSPVSIKRPSSFRRSKSSTDRFIPNRARISTCTGTPTPQPHSSLLRTTPSSEYYKRQLRRVIFGNEDTPPQLLSFGDGPRCSLPRQPRFEDPFCQDVLRDPRFYSSPTPFSSSKPAACRKVSPTRRREHDASTPEFILNYDMLNLVSACERYIAVAGRKEIFLNKKVEVEAYIGCDGIEKSVVNSFSWPIQNDTGADITSLKWAGDFTTSLLAFGTLGLAQVWNVSERHEEVARLDDHRGFVTALAWQGDFNLIAASQSGIHRYDLRIKSPKVATYGIDFLAGTKTHFSSLQWQSHTIAAAAGNTVSLWDSRKSHSCKTPLHNLQHAEAKALEFSPFQSNTLASGGKDGIKFWNVQSGSLRGEIRTRSPVTSVLWSPYRHNEIVASYGNYMGLLNVSSKQILAEWHGRRNHSSKILSLDRIPRSGSVVCMLEDELNLQGWHVFEDVPRANSGLNNGLLDMAPTVR
jgi:hypothetical protein